MEFNDLAEFTHRHSPARSQMAKQRGVAAQTPDWTVTDYPVPHDRVICGRGVPNTLLIKARQQI